MDEAKRLQVEANLFGPARPAVEPWDDFPWHWSRGACDADRVHSSQALAIDVFGTLKMSEPRDRDAILDHLAGRLGLPRGGPWVVDLEWRDPENRMKESWKSRAKIDARTQFDARAASTRSLITFECKFTEGDGGSCSQPAALRTGKLRGARQCDGQYRMQVNPVSGKLARCALAAKGIRYWELIPEVFRHANDVDHQPCPFRGSWYQWMRNLTTTLLIGREENLQPAHVLVYVEGRGLPMSEKLSGGGSGDWQQFRSMLRNDGVTFEAITFQELIGTAESAVSGSNGDAALWGELGEWVRRKAESAVVARQGSP